VSTRNKRRWKDTTIDYRNNFGVITNFFSKRKKNDYTATSRRRNIIVVHVRETLVNSLVRRVFYRTPHAAADDISVERSSWLAHVSDARNRSVAFASRSVYIYIYIYKHTRVFTTYSRKPFDDLFRRAWVFTVVRTNFLSATVSGRCPLRDADSIVIIKTHDRQFHA